MKTLLISLIITLYISCSKKDNQSVDTNNSGVFPLRNYVATDCFTEMQKNICLVDENFLYELYENSTTFEEYQTTLRDYPCLENDEKYRQTLVEEYIQLPLLTRDAFCHIRKTIIVPEFVQFGGIALLSYDINRPVAKTGDSITYPSNGFVMLLSELHRFKTQETTEEYHNRIVQQYFGHDVQNNGLIADFPQMVYHNDEMRSSLNATIIHEVGHFLDYAHNISFGYSFENPYTNWSLLSFESYVNESEETPKVEFYPLVSTTLNYPMDIENKISVFEEFGKAPFTSFYAMSSPAEDFAEIFHAVDRFGHYKVEYQGEILTDESNHPSTTYQIKKSLMNELMKQGFSKVYQRTIEINPNRRNENFFHGRTCQLKP